MGGKAYLFGPFRLEPDERRLSRDGSLVPLTGKAFDLLVYLVEGAGTLQRHNALIARLWPDTVVEPNSLQYNVSLVRRVLADASDVTLQTVRAQGYRLVAMVTREDAPAAARAFAPDPPRPAPAIPAHSTFFCKAPDGARLAYSKLGEGPVVVKVANWLSHLELDLKGGLWTRWNEVLGRGRCLVRYDARGNGMSEWNPPTISFEAWVSDLATVFDAAGVRRAPVIGLSQGAPVAAAFAARHPERVSALVLVGGFARGWRVKGNRGLIAQYEAVAVLVRQAWGGQNPAFRQMFTTSFFPRATQEFSDWWNDLQRQTTTAETAARIMEQVGEVDVRGELGQVAVPTLVLHSSDDAVIPVADGVELATGIRGARFVKLDSGNHVPTPDEPSWPILVNEVEGFLARETLGKNAS